MRAVILGLILGPAWADEPSPGRQCADAAAGAEVEVCLGLAVQHPDDVDSIAAALIAHVDRREADDRALLDALLLTLDPEQAADGARRLGDSGDPRARPVLDALVLTHPDDAVASAAVAAAARQPEPLPRLRRWLADDDLSVPRRIAAGEALGRLGTEEAADTVEDALRRPRQPRPLREALLTTLHDSWPDRTPDRDVVTADGSLWLATGTSWNLAFAMGAAGHFGRTDLVAVGAVTGATAGGTAGYLYGRAWPKEAGPAALYTTASVGGTAAGLLIGAAVDDTADAALLGGLIGEAVGAGTAIAVGPLWPGTSTDAVEGLAIGALTAGATDGVLAFRDRVLQQPDDGERVAATGVALGVGLVAGHGVAPWVDLEGSDPLLVGTGAASGLAAGLLLPVGDAPRLGLPGAGTAIGALAGYGLAGAVDAEPSTVAAGWTGAAFGAAAGYGLGTLASDEVDVRHGAALLLGGAGMAVGAVGAHRDPDPIDDRDVVLSVAATSWAAWESVAVGTLAEVDDRSVGTVVLAPALAGAGATLASNHLDVPVTHTLAASSIGLWGGYAGGVTGELVGADPLLLALIGSNLGLGAGAVAMSPFVGVPPLVVGIADAGGVAGASVGALAASQATDDRDVILGVSLGGAAAGLAAGAALGTLWHRQGERRDVALAPPVLPDLPGRWSVAPLAVRTDGKPGGGLRVTVDRW